MWELFMLVLSEQYLFVLARRAPKQQSRSDKQQGEERIQNKHTKHTRWTPGIGIRDNERNHGNQSLGKCHREQRAGHSTRLEARDEGADESDGEHSEIYQVKALVIPNDAHGSVHPYEDKCCCDRNADIC